MTIDWVKVGEICEAIVQFGGAWVLVIGFILVILKYLKQVGGFFKDLFLIPGRVKFMLSELSHNGGSSLKDAIQRMEGRQISNELKLIYVVDAIQDSGSFETNENGFCVKVSIGYCHLVGRNEEESLGIGWQNFLHPEDRERVSNEWSETIENKSYFVSTYRMMKDGKPFTVFCRAYVLLDPKKNVSGWFGIIKKI
jgi:PAS domain S-box-containing protein